MKFPDQIGYLKDVGKRLGLNIDEPRWYKDLADLVGHNPETVRKWVGGYQSMPERHKKSFEIAIKHRDLQQAARPSPREITEAYGFMPWDGLLGGFENLVSTFKKASIEKQKQLCVHLSAMLSEIDRRLRRGDLGAEREESESEQVNRGPSGPVLSQAGADRIINEARRAASELKNGLPPKGQPK